MTIADFRSATLFFLRATLLCRRFPLIRRRAMVAFCTLIFWGRAIWNNPACKIMAVALNDVMKSPGNDQWCPRLSCKHQMVSYLIYSNTNFDWFQSSERALSVNASIPLNQRHKEHISRCPTIIEHQSGLMYTNGMTSERTLTNPSTDCIC